MNLESLPIAITTFITPLRLPNKASRKCTGIMHWTLGYGGAFRAFSLDSPPRQAGFRAESTLRPTGLDFAHKRLDETVFAAYGWKPDLSDEEILKKLLSLNLERAKISE